ncbi:MAG TPA: hypothetical protein VIJ28_21200 [Chloroflexota bacterium]
MAKRTLNNPPKCKACGFPMIPDETIIDGRGGLRIKRTFLHCVNGQCGHIVRTGEFPMDPLAAAAPR